MGSKGYFWPLGACGWVEAVDSGRVLPRAVQPGHLLVRLHSTAWVGAAFLTAKSLLQCSPQATQLPAPSTGTLAPLPTALMGKPPAVAMPAVHVPSHSPLAGTLVGVTQPFPHSQGPVAGFELVFTIDTYLLYKYNLSFVS